MSLDQYLLIKGTMTSSAHGYLNEEGAKTWMGNGNGEWEWEWEWEYAWD